MPTITIDNKPYELDKLSTDAKQQLEMLAATDAKLGELQRDLAITQTARNPYAHALKGALPTPQEQTLAQGDTLKLG